MSKITFIYDGLRFVIVNFVDKLLCLYWGSVWFTVNYQNKPTEIFQNSMFFLTAYNEGIRIRTILKGEYL